MSVEFKASFEDNTQHFHASFYEGDANFTASFTEPESFTCSFDEYVNASLDPYTGEYEVVPAAFVEQTLNTNDKRMLDDVTVKEIPYHETTNPQQGFTVYIGSNLE